MEVPVIECEGQFKTLRERRGVYAVKKYLHRWVEWTGDGKKLGFHGEFFQKFRKKHNRTYIEVAHHQHLVDVMKPLFGLRRIGTWVVHDEVEGYGVMQVWHDALATVKQREHMPEWLSDVALFELWKVCFFDGVIGGLDRHGNNVVVRREDKALVTIDDEDVFYDKIRTWVKFDRDLRRMVYMASAVRCPKGVALHVSAVSSRAAEILAVADHPVMHGNPTYRFYEVLERNLGRLSWVRDETMRQLLL